MPDRRSAAVSGTVQAVPERPTSKPRLVADNQGLTARGLGKQYRKRPVVRDVTVRVQRTFHAG